MSFNHTSTQSKFYDNCLREDAQSGKAKAVILMLLSISLLNGTIVGVLLRKLRRLSVGSTIILHLATADFLHSFTALPHGFAISQRSPLAGSYLCQATGFFINLTLGSSIYVGTIMTVCRGYAVLRPFQYRNNIKKSLVNKMCLGAWLLSLVFAFMPLVGWGEYKTFHNQCWCYVNSRIYPYNWFVFFGVFYVLPLIINTLGFAGTLRVLISKKHKLTPTKRGNGAERNPRTISEPAVKSVENEKYCQSNLDGKSTSSPDSSKNSLTYMQWGTAKQNLEVKSKQCPIMMQQSCEILQPNPTESEKSKDKKGKPIIKDHHEERAKTTVEDEADNNQNLDVKSNHCFTTMKQSSESLRSNNNERENSKFKLDSKEQIRIKGHHENRGETTDEEEQARDYCNGNRNNSHPKPYKIIENAHLQIGHSKEDSYKTDSNRMNNATKLSFNSNKTKEKKCEKETKQSERRNVDKNLQRPVKFHCATAVNNEKKIREADNTEKRYSWPTRSKPEGTTLDEDKQRSSSPVCEARPKKIGKCEFINKEDINEGEITVSTRTHSHLAIWRGERRPYNKQQHGSSGIESEKHLETIDECGIATAVNYNEDEKSSNAEEDNNKTEEKENSAVAHGIVNRPLSRLQASRNDMRLLIVVLIFTSFLVFCSPSFIVRTLYAINYDISEKVFLIASTMNALNPLINAFLYALLTKEIQTDLSNIICCCCRSS